MSCPLTNTLSAQTYNNTCVLALSARDDVKGVLSDCCANKTAPVITTSCYEYCNTTSADIELCVGLTLQTLDPVTTIKKEDITCFIGDETESDSNSASSAAPSSSSTAGSSSAVSSATSSPSASAVSSTTSSPSASAVSSATSSPSASSTKASKASGAGSISLGAMAVVGLVVFGLLV